MVKNDPLMRGSAPPMSPQHAFTFINAILPDTDATTLRVAGERIAAIGEPPQTRDVVIDLAGDWLLPGLINAHDHLELNNFPRLKWRERYDSVRDWIADFQPRFKTDPALIEPMSAPLDDRLLIGRLKNLLSGVTTVQHHNPLHHALRRRDYPVRVAQKYGWAHSFLIDGAERVRASFRRTRHDRPWIIHLAEGTDDEALGELSRLDALGCLRDNTLIVHGVGLTESDHALMRARGAGLIWCPSSNLFMLGRTAEVRELATARRVALGSDSRLSGERDLLEELRIARAVGGLDERRLFAMVTTDAARLLRLDDVGELRVGAQADLVVMSNRKSEIAPRPSFGAWLGHAARRDVQLVMIGGRALLSAPCYARVFEAMRQPCESIVVDGAEKRLEHSLVARLRRCSIQEPGVVL